MPDILPIRADLHCHSEFSDGKQSPAWLLQRAAEKQLTHLAITDHDCVAALTSTPEHAGVTLVKGVEISCSWQNREIHVVGLLIDPASQQLTELLARQQQARLRRAVAVDQRLASKGITGLESYLAALPCIAVTRTHMADFLIAGGYCKSHQKAFSKYLAKGAQAYVPAQWCEMATAINTIQDAGGMAVLAHPGRYRLNRRQLQALMTDFSGVGGDALESSYPNIDNTMRKFLGECASERNLRVSAGSDFHDPAATWTDLGKFPPLRDDPATVFNDPRWLAAYPAG